MVHHAPSVSVRLDSVASPSDNSARYHTFLATGSWLSCRCYVIDAILGLFGSRWGLETASSRLSETPLSRMMSEHGRKLTILIIFYYIQWVDEWMGEKDVVKINEPSRFTQVNRHV